MIYEAEVLFLRKRIAEYGLKFSPLQTEQFGVYLSELLDWGGKMNLIGLFDPRKVVTELFFDSLIPVPFLPHQGKMLDVGSGAGIPGFPLKFLMPDLETHLLEPNSKKVSFLKHIIRLLELEKITVIKGRIDQDDAGLPAEGYDLITARALTGLATTIEWCAPFLKPGGMIIHFLGTDFQQSLHQARGQMEKNTLSLNRQIDYRLPEKQADRHIVIFRKDRN